MKVLHLWLSDSPVIGGGGAGSMFRLHTGMREAGIDSSILCEAKTTTDPNVVTKPMINRVEKAIRKFTSNIGLNDIHRISSFNLNHHPAYREADIVNYHGLLDGFVNYLALPRLTATKPTVFTLRSMWSMTGHCGFSLDCSRWKTGCGSCPYPKSHPPIKRDATRLEWKLKQWAFNHSQLTLVTLSTWLQDQVRESLLKDLPTYTIANGIDTASYSPIERQTCRALLGIPEGKLVLMFMAVSLSSYRKGGDLLIASLERLPEVMKKKVVLLLLGHNSAQIAQKVTVPTVELGYLDHPRLKAMAYSAADLFVFPTRAESFGQVILESMACGTPVAGFRLGPMPEVIRPGRTGVLAEPENPQSLCDEIVAILEDDQTREAMRQRCRQMAVDEYSISREVENYIKLYQQVLRH